MPLAFPLWRIVSMAALLTLKLAVVGTKVEEFCRSAAAIWTHAPGGPFFGSSIPRRHAPSLSASA
jgi:hypothetical protein